MSELIIPEAKNHAAKTIKEGKRELILSMLPPSVDRQNFITSLMIAVNECGDCDQTSLLKAAANTARLGLIPGSVAGQAYFVPFYNKKKGVKECQLIPGYQGYLQLGFRSGFLKDVYAEVVTQEELNDFRTWVDDDGPHLLHELKVGRKLEKGNIVLAYCVYRTQKGGRGIEVVQKSQIDSVDTGKNVWKTNYVAMCRKTAIRRAAKFWDKTPTIAEAVSIDEQAERGVSQTGLSNLGDVAIEKQTSLEDYKTESKTTPKIDLEETDQHGEPVDFAIHDSLFSQIGAAKNKTALTVLRRDVADKFKEGLITDQQDIELNSFIDTREGAF